MQVMETTETLCQPALRMWQISLPVLLRCCNSLHLPKCCILICCHAQAREAELIRWQVELRCKCSSLVQVFPSLTLAQQCCR